MTYLGSILNMNPAVDGRVRVLNLSLPTPYSKVIALSSLGTPLLFECQMSHVGLHISTVGVQLVVICLVGGTLLE